MPSPTEQAYPTRLSESESSITNLWLGKEKWGVRGDGVTQPFCVYQLDPTRSAFGFLPFGYSLPGMLEQQAHALAAVLNEMQGRVVSDEAWMKEDSHRHVHWDDAADDWRRCEVRHYS